MYIWNAPKKLDIKLMIYELRTYLTPHPAVKFMSAPMSFAGTKVRISEQKNKFI